MMTFKRQFYFKRPQGTLLPFYLVAVVIEEESRDHREMVCFGSTAIHQPHSISQQCQRYSHGAMIPFSLSFVRDKKPLQCCTIK